MVVSHRKPAGFLDRQKHRVVGPKHSRQLNAAENEQEQHADDDTDFNRCGPLLSAAQPPCAPAHRSRISVVADKLAGIPGHGTSGAKGWLALIVMNRRLGPGRPTVAHDSVQLIDVPSSHSQLCGKLTGNPSGGAKLIALCIAD
jgi:hypothetical protein